MNINKIVFGLALSLLVATNIGTASATTTSAESNGAEEVLFKIHDIKPVKNHDGEVIACDFNTTFYNRSKTDVKEALIDFEWKDEAIEFVIDQEKKKAAEESKRSFGRSYSETERKTSKTIGVMVEVPAIKSYKQVTVSSRINTDRCFLLINKVDFNIRSCSLGSSDVSSKNSRSRRGRASGSSCEKLFKFVSPEDAQYYLDFKEITVEEEVSQEKAKTAKAKSEVDGIYEKTVKAMIGTESILNSIK